MTDNELLELAAKAVGIPTKSMMWNPLENDGDALRLVSRLSLQIEFEGLAVQVIYYNENARNNYQVDEPLLSDPDSALRRAIVRAAAEIGASK